MQAFIAGRGGGGLTHGTRRIADRASFLLVFLFMFHFVLVQTYYLPTRCVYTTHVHSLTVLATQPALPCNHHTCLPIPHTQPNASLATAIRPLAQSTCCFTSSNKLILSAFCTVFKVEHPAPLQNPKPPNANDASVSRTSAMRASTMLLWSNAAN